MTQQPTPNGIIEQLEITGLTQGGRGVARHNGKTIFVNLAVPGDTVQAKVTHSADRFDEADCLKITAVSKDRATPFCDYYAQCSGCQLQHLSVDAQRFWKTQNLMTGLSKAIVTKQSKTTPSLVGDERGYRRQARLGLMISKKDKVARLGFKQKNSNELIDIKQCPLLSPALNQAIQDNRETLIKSASRSYKEITFVEADNGVFIHNASEKAPQESEVTSENGILNPTAAPLNLEPRPHYQLNTEINQAWSTVTLELPRSGFIQENTPLNQAVVQQALQWLELKTSHKVLDLFCGIGNFTLPVAQQVAQAVGIESDHALTELATHNAQINQIPNATFHKGNLLNDVRPLHWFHNNHYDRILMTPDRSGALELCKTLGTLKAEIIVYISCNTATLSRDLQALQNQGYRLTKVGFIDLGPHTSHTETMVQLTKTQKAPPKAKKRKIFKL